MGRRETGRDPPVAASTDPIVEIQRAYLSTIETQLLATLVLIGLLALGVASGRRIELVVTRRYSTQIAEATRVVWLMAVIAVFVYAFSVIWRVTFVIWLAIDAAVVDRWTVVQQLTTVAVILIAYLLVRFVNRSIDTLAKTTAVTDHQSEVAYHVADVGIAGAAATVILTLWGVDLTNVFIGAGAITAIIGLAARETFTAMIAGFILLFSRPFRVGDWIEVNERTGIVKDVTIFNTKIQTFGDEHVLVPNDEITSSQLTNLSRNNQLRIEVEVGVDYDTDLERAQTVLSGAVEDLDSIKSTPNPQVVAKRFDDSAIILELRVWIGDPTMRRKWAAQTDVIQAIKGAFEREDISIPFPQRTHAARSEEGFRVGGSIPETIDVPEIDD